ncbi:3-dehydroquinate dehydratase-1 [Elusimicrobium posterum]|uniref:type I 3-dehydroquinate dehydratase n=1 Tax=Elusimicrobium posterum TaxID=3116653 RepID=UPI003C7532A3
MLNKICAVACGKDVKELTKNLKALIKQTKTVEIRSDFAADFTPAHLAAFAKETKNNRTVFTCRAKNEGGQFNGSEKQRIEILQSALKNKFTYVDFELKTVQKNKLKFSAGEAKKLIISYHDFNKTPSMAALVKIKKDMLKYKPAVIKLALMVKTQKDIFTLTRFLLDTIEENQQIILLGMGEKAVFTRVMFPLMGSALTYAADGKAVAPGQLKINEFKQIYKTLKAV